MPTHDAERALQLTTDRPIWDRFFSVFPLVIVNSKEEDGQHNLAPKHLAMPWGWEDHYCFVCSAKHTTYRNIRRHGLFTVTYLRPAEVSLVSLAAAPICEDGSKPSLQMLPTFPAHQVEGILVQGCYLFLECALQKIPDGLGPNSLIIGDLLGAAAHEEALRTEEQDENDQLFQFPLLA
jgi:flavin reductase (DIM6/NTAB) family NADH-FMN oxidoreductase RutF